MQRCTVNVRFSVLEQLPSYNTPSYPVMKPYLAEATIKNVALSKRMILATAMFMITPPLHPVNRLFFKALNADLSFRCGHSLTRSSTCLGETVP